MTAIKTLDGRRILPGRGGPPLPGGSQGPRGGTGKSNSPASILKRLMEAQPELKKLISKLKKEGEKPSKSKKKTKTMKAMGGGMAMKKKGYAMGGAMKKKGYAKGGAMKRTGHMDMRKGGLFK